jgi:hypothetical protein
VYQISFTQHTNQCEPQQTNKGGLDKMGVQKCISEWLLGLLIII